MFRQSFYMKFLCFINYCVIGDLKHQILLYKWNRTKSESQLRKKFFQIFELFLTSEKLVLTFKIIYDLDQFDKYEFLENMKQIVECFSNLFFTKNWNALKENLHHDLLNFYTFVLMFDLFYYHFILILLSETNEKIKY